MKLFRTALLAGLLSTPAMAHDVWISDAYRLNFGHSETGPEPYSEEKISTISALAGDGSAIKLEFSRQDEMTHLSPAAAPAMIKIILDNGYYTKTESEGGFQEGAFADFPDAVETKQFMKYGKTLFGWSPIADQPQNMPLEIVPLADPASLKPGQALPLQVLFHGQPLADAVVLRDVLEQQVTATTDADGRTEIAYDPSLGQLYTVRNEMPSREADVSSIGMAGALYLHPAQ